MTDIHTIKPIILTPLFSERQIFLFWVIIGIIIIAILYIIISKLYKKRLEKKAAEALKNIVIDYKTPALKKLNNLENLIEKHKFHEFYLKSSKIIKEYLKNLYKSNILEMTTSEIEDNKQLPFTHQDLILEFLKKADQIKFAKSSEKEELAKKAFDLGIKIIKY